MPTRRAADDLSEDVIAGARAGDADAIAVLWRSLHPLLLRYLRGVGGDERAEDLASTVWIEFARVLPTLDDDPASLRRMLFTIARRRRIDEFRRHARSPRMTDIDETDAVELQPDDLEGAVELLRSLPPSQAEVVALRVIGGFSAREVGEITGRSEGAVRVMAHRALATLRQQLESGSTGPTGESTDPLVSQDDVTNQPSASTSAVK